LTAPGSANSASVEDFLFKGHKPCRRSLAKRLHDFFRHHRVEHRLIALNVDDHVGIEGSDGLGDAVGAGTMQCGSHDRPAAEVRYGAADAVVIGGDENVVEVPGPPRALVHMLDHGPAEDVGQGLSFKPCGLVTRRDDADHAHGARCRRSWCCASREYRSLPVLLAAGLSPMELVALA
jgi:hypothetical protein